MAITIPKKIKIYQSDRKDMGFLVDYEDGKETSSHKSAKSWAGADSKEYVYDNEPISGIKINDFTSRYSTSNKVFDVEDPRGFKLQIYADCLCDVLHNSTIVNGVIQSKCIWVRYKNPILVVIDSPKHKEILATNKKIKNFVFIKPSEFQSSMVYKDKSNNEFLFFRKTAPSITNFWYENTHRRVTNTRIHTTTLNKEIYWFYKIGSYQNDNYIILVNRSSVSNFAVECRLPTPEEDGIFHNLSSSDVEKVLGWNSSIKKECIADILSCNPLLKEHKIRIEKSVLLF